MFACRNLAVPGGWLLFACRAWRLLFAYRNLAFSWARWVPARPAHVYASSITLMVSLARDLVWPALRCIPQAGVSLDDADWTVNDPFAAVYRSVESLWALPLESRTSFCVLASSSGLGGY